MTKTSEKTWEVRHCWPNPSLNSRITFMNGSSAIREMQTMSGNGISILYRDSEIIASRQWQRKRIEWLIPRLRASTKRRSKRVP